jgi:hypothetical protein
MLRRRFRAPCKGLFAFPLRRDDWMQGCAPCTAVVFLLAQKDGGKMRQGFPMHSLRSASAMTLLPAELRIVHRRKVPASVSAPQGADKKQICKSYNSHISTRGARNRSNHNASTSDSQSGNDKRSGLSTWKADYKGGSPCFLFGDFFKSEKATRCRTESCIPRPPRGGERGTIGRRAARPARRSSFCSHRKTTERPRPHSLAALRQFTSSCGRGSPCTPSAQLRQ